MNKKKATIITIFILIMPFIWACGANKQADEKSENKVLIAVETKTVKTESIQQYITVSSKVKPINEVAVVPKVSGTVKSVNVSLGDYVKKGDTLFIIDDKDLRLQLNQVQASLNSAEANYNLTVEGNMKSQLEQLKSSVESYEIQYKDILENLEKMEELYKSGAVAKNELDKLKTSADTLKLQLDTAKKNLELTENNISAYTKEVANSSVEQARAGVESAQNQINNTTVKAEIDGIVSSNNVTAGQIISPQSPSMTISDMDIVRLSFQVSEEVIGRIDNGSKVYISIKSVSDIPFEAEVTNISKVADSKTSLYPIEVDVSNENHIIKPGMFASIRVILNNKDNIITLPLNAVIHKDEGSFVYVIAENNTVHKTAVETGIANDEEIEITSGLSEGAEVVVKGQDFITDGLEVNVIK